MASRDHARVPGKLQVEFRSPTALLVAYTVNLSRGGMFIRCDGELPPEGAELDLDITLPDRNVVSIQGVVTWQRQIADETGPVGVGVQFESFNQDLGAIIDGLVSNFAGLCILVQCVDSRDRATLVRMLKAIISTAEVVFADDDTVATSLIGADTDLVIVDVDENERAARATLRFAHEENNVPCIALCQRDELTPDLARDGAAKILGNPPSSSTLRKAVLQLLSKPSRISQTQA